MVMTTRSTAVSKALLACGMTAPLLDIVMTAAVGALEPGYSHTRQFISELGAVGSGHPFPTP